MISNPQLAHDVGQLKNILEQKHVAVDKITGLGLLIALLGKEKDAQAYDPIKELDLERRIRNVLSESAYEWNRYMDQKEQVFESEYNKLIAEQSTTIERDTKLIKEQRTALDRGNKVIKAAIQEGRERGLQ